MENIKTLDGYIKEKERIEASARSQETEYLELFAHVIRRELESRWEAENGLST